MVDLKKLRNLAQYKGLSDEEIIKRVEGNEDDDDITNLFLDKKEKKLAKKFQKKYLEDYTIENISDINTLKQLIYLEVLNLRLQETINAKSKAKEYISDKLIKSIHDNIKEISNLKDRLGLSKIKDDLNKSDAYKALDTLKKKFKVWREKNQGSRTAICPHCGKMILFKIRTDKYDAQKHPFFKDRILHNTHLIKLLSQGKITKEDIALILETSPHYVDWLLSKLPPIKTQVKEDNPLETDSPK